MICSREIFPPCTDILTPLSCKSKGPVTFNNRRGGCVEGLPASAHNPLNAQPPTANTVTDTEALNWKQNEMTKGRVLYGKERRDWEVRT